MFPNINEQRNFNSIVKINVAPVRKWGMDKVISLQSEISAFNVAANNNAKDEGAVTVAYF